MNSAPGESNITVKIKEDRPMSIPTGGAALKDYLLDHDDQYRVWYPNIADMNRG